MGLYLAAYLVALVVSFALTPLVTRLAHARRYVDAPGTRKVHDVPIPRIGGVAIILALLAGAAVAFVLVPAAAAVLRGWRTQILAVIAASALIGVVGLADDIRSMRARTKLVAQLAAAGAVCLLGVRVDVLAADGLGVLHLGVFGWLLTIVWIVGVTNAVNFVDGLDGLAGGISAIAATALGLFAIRTGQPAVVTLTLALLGSLTGFLAFNLNPARIFMGDCGSMFVGFCLASLGVLCAKGASNIVAMAVLALALGIPIFDTLFSMLRRFLERRSVFSPDRNHLHHRLLDYGLEHRHAVLVIYGATLGATGLGMFLMVTRGAATIVVFCCVCVLLVLLFRVVGSVRLSESVGRLRRNFAIAREAKEQQKVFEHAQLRIREAHDFDNWWLAVCAAAQDMGLSRLMLKRIDGGGPGSEILWRNSVELSRRRIISTTVPIILGDDAQPPLQAEVDVPVDVSLEAAALRVKLFSRLIDENSPAALPLAGTVLGGSVLKVNEIPPGGPPQVVC